MNAETIWAEWVSARLNERGWKQADLVRESNGTIRADRVSKWVNGKESPSHRLAVIAANVLHVPQEEALAAGGFNVEKGDRESRLDAALAAIREATPASRLDSLLSDVPDSELQRILYMRARLREGRESGIADEDAMSDAEAMIEVHPEGTKSTYGLAAYRGVRKADEIPHAE